MSVGYGFRLACLSSKIRFTQVWTELLAGLWSPVDLGSLCNHIVCYIRTCFFFSTKHRMPISRTYQWTPASHLEMWKTHKKEKHTHMLIHTLGKQNKQTKIPWGEALKMERSVEILFHFHVTGEETLGLP